MARNLRLLVFGGRTYGDPDAGRNQDWQSQRDHVFAALDEVHARRVVACVIEGGAPGADTCAREWAEARGIPCVPFEAEWDNIDVPGAVPRKRRDGTWYNAAAGPQRNQRMVDEGGLTGAVQFPGGRGTADMRRRLDAAGVRVWEPLEAVV